MLTKAVVLSSLVAVMTRHRRLYLPPMWATADEGYIFFTRFLMKFAGPAVAESCTSANKSKSGSSFPAFVKGLIHHIARFGVQNQKAPVKALAR